MHVEKGLLYIKQSNQHNPFTVDNPTTYVVVEDIKQGSDYSWYVKFKSLGCRSTTMTLENFKVAFRASPYPPKEICAAYFIDFNPNLGENKNCRWKVKSLVFRDIVTDATKEAFKVQFDLYHTHVLCNSFYYKSLCLEGSSNRWIPDLEDYEQ